MIIILFSVTVFSIMLCAGDTVNNTHKDDLFTAANEAYGMHSRQEVVPVYETVK